MFAAVENTTESVPAFLIKLWTLVEDPSTDNLIQWDPSGTSFHVYDQQNFSREILPMYFKHNNIASFVRQLNMYGFRKVAHIEQGGLKVEKDDLQFQHQFFQRGEKELLQYIKRKVSVRNSDSLAAAAPDYSRVLTDVKQVKGKQDNMEQNLEYIKRENKLLWREVATLRQKHHKQQQIVNKLIQFLVSLVSSNRSGLTIPPMRRIPLAINDVSQVATSTRPPAAHVELPVEQLQVPETQEHDGDTPNFLVSGTQPAQVTVDTQISSPAVGENYSIQSPASDDYILSPTDSSSGPIIHELTDPIVIPSNLFGNIQANSTVPSGVQSPVQTVGQQAAGTSQGNSEVMPRQILVLPARIKQDPSSVASSSSSLSDTLNSTSLMSPKIEVAPSLEDALQYGLIVPSTSASANVASTSLLTPQAASQSKVQRKKRTQQPLTPDSSPSPSKKPSGGTVNSVPLLDHQAKTSSAVACTSQAKNDEAHGHDANLAVTASKDGDEFTLNADQLDLLSSDMDGLKTILQDQYKVDPSFLMELFEASNPWPVIPDKDLDGLKMDADKDEAGTSSGDGTNILGNELVEYNPRDELFPELMVDNIMADIDDID